MTKQKAVKIVISRSINAMSKFNSTPEYAKQLLKEVTDQGLSVDQVAKRIGVHKRSLHRSASEGFSKYPMQYILEHLAGRK